MSGWRAVVASLAIFAAAISGGRAVSAWTRAPALVPVETGRDEVAEVAEIEREWQQTQARLTARFEAARAFARGKRGLSRDAALEWDRASSAWATVGAVTTQGGAK